MRPTLLLAALAATLAPAPALAGAPGVPIGLGDRVASEIRPEGDVDPYSFDGVAGTRLAATVSGGKGGLVPDLALIGPDGADLDLGAALRRKGTKVSLRGFVLPATGRYSLLVRSAGAAGGAYELRTKGRVPRKVAIGPVVIGAGETRDLRAFGIGDAAWTVRLSAPEGAGLRVGAVLDPTGGEMPGGAEAFGPGGTARRAKVTLIGGFGEYALRLVGGEEEVRVRATVKVRLPKAAKVRLDLAGGEPRPAAVDPVSGPVGARISVLGEGFAPDAEVLLGGVAARNPLHVSASEVTAEVPGRIEAGAALPVLVRNPDGQSNELPGAFTVRVPPGVHSVSPPLAAPGDTVSVHGTGFGEGAAVRFGLLPAPAASVVNDGLLLAEVPAGLPEGPVDVTVTTTAGLSGRKAGGLVVEAPPVLTGVDPAEALPGETVRVLGDRFRTGATVRFGDRNSPVATVETTSEILARVPVSGLPPGRVDVTVVKPFGTAATLPGGLAVLATPAWRGLVVTGAIDGPRPGGTPKAIELYATADLDDLSRWSIDVATNGGAWSGKPYVLSGSAKAGSFLRVASEDASFEAYFGFAPDFTTSLLVVNGNDAIGLFEGATLVDIFGDPADVAGASDHSAAWNHQDGFAYRKDGAGPSATFDEEEWTLSGPDLLDAQGSDGRNGDAGVTVPFGEYER